MKLLCAIPHYHRLGDARGVHGFGREEAEVRAASLGRVLAALHEHLGNNQCMLNLAAPSVCETNSATANELRVVVCTVKEHHVFERMEKFSGCYEHHLFTGNPRHLGFECHKVLARHVDEFDLFAYLEDDLIVHDPLLLRKVTAFASATGPNNLLLPHRYERSHAPPFLKTYVDGPLAPKFTSPLQRYARPCHRQEVLQMGGETVVCRRPSNPHAGCFFLTAEQMKIFRDSGHCGVPDSRFVGPLEGAATFALAKRFNIYKTSPRWANFLEVEHSGTGSTEYYFNKMTAAFRTTPTSNGVHEYEFTMR